MLSHLETWAKTDPLGRLTVTADQLTITAAGRDVASFCARDCGAGGLVDITGQAFAFRITAQGAANNGALAPWMVSAGPPADIGVSYSAPPDAISLVVYNLGFLLLLFHDSVVGFDDSGSATLNTWYHCRIVRDGSTVSVLAYADADHTTHLWTLAIPVVDPGRAWRYVQIGTNWIDASGGDPAASLSAEIAAVDIGEPDADCYRLYRGPSPDAIDTGRPLAAIPAGEAAWPVVQPPSSVYHYAVAPVSAAGVEGPATAACRVELDADGRLVAPRPNRPTWATVAASAAGTLRVTAEYSARGSAADAATLQIARVTAAGPDWADPLATAPVRGRTARLTMTAGPFADGETVRLACRAATAAGRGGPVLLLPPAVADASAPPAPPLLTAEPAP